MVWAREHVSPRLFGGSVPNTKHLLNCNQAADTPKHRHHLHQDPVLGKGSSSTTEENVYSSLTKMASSSSDPKRKVPEGFGATTQLVKRVKTPSERNEIALRLDGGKGGALVQAVSFQCVGLEGDMGDWGSKR